MCTKHVALLSLQACQPTAADHQSRMEVITAARNALTRAFARGYQGVTVQAYGSFVSGFYNSSSDLDISFSAYMETAFMPPEQRAEMFRDMEEQQFVDVVSGAERAAGCLAFKQPRCTLRLQRCYMDCAIPHHVRTSSRTFSTPWNSEGPQGDVGSSFSRLFCLLHAVLVEYLGQACKDQAAQEACQQVRCTLCCKRALVYIINAIHATQ